MLYLVLIWRLNLWARHDEFWNSWHCICTELGRQDLVYLRILSWYSSLRRRIKLMRLKIWWICRILGNLNHRRSLLWGRSSVWLWFIRLKSWWRLLFNNWRLGPISTCVYCSSYGWFLVWPFFALRTRRNVVLGSLLHLWARCLWRRFYPPILCPTFARDRCLAAIRFTTLGHFLLTLLWTDFILCIRDLRWILVLHCRQMRQLWPLLISSRTFQSMRRYFLVVD